MITAKLLRIFNKYRALIAKRHKNAPNGGRGIGPGKKWRLKSVRSKNRVLDFYIVNGRWPKRTAKTKRERSLGAKFENFISKESIVYDSTLRRIVMATGRRSNHKRKHDISGFKQEIIDFLKTHGRVPMTSYKYEKIPGEARLRHKLDYYTQERNDMSFLGVVYDYDKCHLSKIPSKFRPFLNRNLETDKPLIRIVK
jgi:hypothetical protein